MSSQRYGGWIDATIARVAWVASSIHEMGDDMNNMRSWTWVEGAMELAEIPPEDLWIHRMRRRSSVDVRTATQRAFFSEVILGAWPQSAFLGSLLAETVHDGEVFEATLSDMNRVLRAIETLRALVPQQKSPRPPLFSVPKTFSLLLRRDELAVYDRTTSTLLVSITWAGWKSGPEVWTLPGGQTVFDDVVTLD